MKISVRRVGSKRVVEVVFAVGEDVSEAKTLIMIM